MLHRIAFVFGVAGMCLVANQPPTCLAQTQVLSSEPPNVEYQYQMYYPRWYGGYGGYGYGYGGHGGYGGYAYGGYGGAAWNGPGLALGGSLPSRGREGISSYYGLPLPPPLGAGVFMNSFAYSTQLPGPLSFGLASSGAPTATPPINGQPIMQANGNPFTPNVSGVRPAANSSTPVSKPVQTSSPEAIERSRNVESFGDENVKQHQWMQAFVNYRNAVEIADDRAEAHTRLGFACLALKKFPEASREFKRAFTLDPATAQSGETLTSVFGPDSQELRTDVTRGVALWAKEDLKDQDRLFLLGVVLRYEQDPRATPILEAAYRIAGSGDHLVALLTPVSSPIMQASAPGTNGLNSEIPPAPTPEPPELMVLPPLHQQPLALQQSGR